MNGHPVLASPLSPVLRFQSPVVYWRRRGSFVVGLTSLSTVPLSLQIVKKLNSLSFLPFFSLPSARSTFKSGASHLKLSESSVNEDLEAVYAHTVLHHNIAPSNIFLLGRSLGSSPSARLASILTCGNPSLNPACLANIQHTKIFERIRKSPRCDKQLKTPLLGGLLLQSAMKSCLRTKLDFLFKNSAEEVRGGREEGERGLCGERGRR